jgi:ribosomal protein L7Ae-like RNA K-turn-binding protein
MKRFKGNSLATTRAETTTKVTKNKPRAFALRKCWSVAQFQELNKEARDILLDRLRKEVVPLVEKVPNNERKYIIIYGVNQVSRAIKQREVEMVIYANNPNSSVGFGHISVLSRLFQVPTCTIHLSSAALGEIFQLKSVAVFGLKKLPTEENTSEKIGPFSFFTQEFRQRHSSIISFLQSKASPLSVT